MRSYAQYVERGLSSTLKKCIVFINARCWLIYLSCHRCQSVADSILFDKLMGKITFLSGTRTDFTTLLEYEQFFLLLSNICNLVFDF